MSTANAGVLLVQVAVAATAGTVALRTGLGAAGAATGTLVFSHPQFEVGTARTGWISTGSPTTVTDYTLHATSGLVTLATAPVANAELSYKNPWPPSSNVFMRFGTGDGTSTAFSLPFNPSTPVLYKSDWGGNQTLYSTNRTNLCLQSQTIGGTAPWSTANITYGNNDTVSPSGATDADTITFTAAVATTINSGNMIATSTTMVYSIYTKGGSAATYLFILRNTTTATNLQVGTFTTATGAVSGAGWTSTSVGGGWYRLSFAQATGITVGDSLIVYAGMSGATPSAGSKLWVWGAQVEADALTSYIPTTTTVGSATDITSIAPSGAVVMTTAPAANALLTWTGTMGPMP